METSITDTKSIACAVHQLQRSSHREAVQFNASINSVWTNSPADSSLLNTVLWSAIQERWDGTGVPITSTTSNGAHPVEAAMNFERIDPITNETGVVNIVTNAPQDAGEGVGALIDHPAVKRINFTGSTSVGRSDAQA